MLAWPKLLERAVAIPTYDAGSANMHAVHACTVLMAHGDHSVILRYRCEDCGLLMLKSKSAFAHMLPSFKYNFTQQQVMLSLTCS